MRTLAQADSIAHPESLNGIMARTGPVSSWMHEVGGLMNRMGPYAPPCVVEPYREIREILLNSIGAVLEEAKRSLGDAQFEAWKTQWLVPLMQMATMPVVTEMWTDAPSQWKRPTITLGRFGARRGAFGSISPLMDNLCVEIEARTGRPCPRTPEPAWQRYGRYGMEIVGGVVVAWAAPAVTTAYWVAISLAELGQATSSQQITPAFASMVQVLDQVRTTFIPEVYQQMVSAKKLVAGSGGDSARLEASMRSTNPWLEPSLPENWDGSFEMHRAASEPTSPWVPLLFGILVALGVAVVVGGDS